MYPINNNYNNFYNRQSMAPPSNIIWVQGIEGAKAQQIQPNSSLLLLDSENDQFYIKVCDQYGICAPLKTYRFEEIIAAAPALATVEEQLPQVDMSKYVTKEELEQIIANLNKPREEAPHNEQPVSKYITANATASK